MAIHLSQVDPLTQPTQKLPQDQGPIHKMAFEASGSIYMRAISQKGLCGKWMRQDASMLMARRAMGAKTEEALARSRQKQLQLSMDEKFVMFVMNQSGIKFAD